MHTGSSSYAHPFNLLSNLRASFAVRSPFGTPRGHSVTSPRAPTTSPRTPSVASPRTPSSLSPRLPSITPPRSAPSTPPVSLSYWDTASGYGSTTEDKGSPAAGIKWGNSRSSQSGEGFPSSGAGGGGRPNTPESAMRAHGLYYSPVERAASAPETTALGGTAFVTVLRHGNVPSDVEMSPRRSEADLPHRAPVSGAYTRRRQSLPGILENPKKGALHSPLSR